MLGEVPVHFKPDDLELGDVTIGLVDVDEEAVLVVVTGRLLLGSASLCPVHLMSSPVLASSSFLTKTSPSSLPVSRLW